MAAVQPGEAALDVCCGTGDIAAALHAAGAKVVGLDFSEAMLDIARSRGQKGVEYLRGDAMEIPFDSNSFDIVTIGYGLRNLASWERGLEEMVRVARPGGRVLMLEFAKPKNRWWRSIYLAALKHVVPISGRIFCRDASTYGYIHESLLNYPEPERVAAKLSGLGCKDVSIRPFLGGAMTLHFGRKAPQDGRRND